MGQFERRELVMVECGSVGALRAWAAAIDAWGVPGSAAAWGFETERRHLTAYLDAAEPDGLAVVEVWSRARSTALHDGPDALIPEAVRQQFEWARLGAVRFLQQLRRRLVELRSPTAHAVTA